jgi:DNA-binding FrmR family transcriptional regulator
MNDTGIKKNLIHRLKIARGHLDKVISMVEKDDYCIDVIHQSLAVQAALKQVDQKILKNHMETCVAESIREGKTKEVINEVMKVVEKS